MPYGKLALDAIESSGNLTVTSNNLFTTGNVTVYGSFDKSEGPRYKDHQLFTTSGTFTAQVTGFHCVTVVGAGGSGAAGKRNNFINGIFTKRHYFMLN